MREYRNQLGMLAGTVIMFLAVQPLQAAIPGETQSQSGADNIELEPSKDTSKLSSKTLLAQTPDVLVPNPEITIDGDEVPAVTPTPAPEINVDDNQVPAVTPTPEITIDGEQVPAVTPTPEITIDGDQVPAIAPAPAAPPYLPRAVAPPVGDIAVSNIDATPDLIDLGTPALVPRLVLRDAPAREVLAVLARFAGLNLVFTDGQGEGAVEGGPTISLDLENEPVQEVFNSVLLVSGLNANRRGNTIFVGSSLPDTARNLVSRTLRLNQVEASTAATFLATQGASVQILEQLEEEVLDPETQRVVRTVLQPPTIRSLTAEAAEGGLSNLLLRGLSVSTDDRLNSITLIGEPRKVQVATSFLTQLDARRRQVAVNVRVIDVNLLNTENFNTSFSFGVEDGFVAVDEGAAAFNYGPVRPPTQSERAGSVFNSPVIGLPLPAGSEGAPFFDVQPDAPFGDTNFQVPAGTSPGTLSPSIFARPNFGTTDNPFQPGVSEVTEDGVEFSLPSLYQFPTRFLAQLEAQVTSGNAKILTDPTLVVQEGQSASVQLTQEVFAGTELVARAVGEDSVLVEQPIIKDAGLLLEINVSRVGDNGFVALSVNPTVSSISGAQNTPVGTITLLQERTVNSGEIRIRDGQTLILSGIIQESDRTTVSKVPILGDIPILGALFRSTTNDNERREVIVLLTPQIVDENSNFGYNYVPGQDAREMLRQQGLTVPGNP